MNQVYIARQPIFDAKLNVCFYELLYRHEDTDQAIIEDGDEATAHLLSSSLIEIGLQRIANHRPVFINLTRNFITGKWPLPLEKEWLGLEILEDVDIDDEVLAALKNFAAQGYRISLDDFIFKPHLVPVLSVAHYVKLDVLALGPEGVADQLALLTKFPVKLIAERVETKAEFELYRDMGFQYFQGYFMAKPRLISGRQLSANRANTLRLLAQIQDPVVSVSELEQIIRNDVVLSVKLLRYINSAQFGLSRKFESVRQAVVYLGMQPLKVWISLIIMSSIDEQPTELMRLSMVRAKMCELLAKELDEADTSRFFTVGLFSTLDALLDIPMEEALKSLPLTQELAAGLLQRTGSLGQILTTVLDYEQGKWQEKFLQLEATQVSGIYTQAVEWADGMLGSV